MKLQRHAKILELIQEHNIETQEDLTEKLKKAGFTTTQATISRDIKELRLSKVTYHNGKYKYAVSVYDDEIKVSAKYKNILHETIIKADLSSSFAVVKTFPGMANAAAAAIDNMKWDGIVGTLAGDDTLFVAFRTENEAKDFIERFKIMLCI